MKSYFLRAVCFGYSFGKMLPRVCAKVAIYNLAALLDCAGCVARYILGAPALVLRKIEQRKTHAH
jgi:hypothetical protein